MVRSLTAAVLALALVAVVSPVAQARAMDCSYTNSGRTICSKAPAVHVARSAKHRRATRIARRHPAEAPAPGLPAAETTPAHDANANAAGPLVTIDGCSGLNVRVAAEHASKFQGFLCALKAAGHHISSVGTACQAYGHMPGSKHDWGGACDVMQRARNVAAGFMYHVTALAHRFGLKDGCEWRNRDCGHVEVPGSNRVARAEHYSIYASADRRKGRRL